MSIVEDYISGSDVTPGEMNTIQDHYVEALGNWWTFGGINLYSGFGAQWFGPGSHAASPSPSWAFSSAIVLSSVYIDPADLPES